MNLMVFQASRRQLVSELSTALSTSTSPTKTKHLETALEAADAEVKRMEFWSDLKNVTETGDSVGLDGDGFGISGAREGVGGSDVPANGKGKERAV